MTWADFITCSCCVFIYSSLFQWKLLVKILLLDGIEWATVYARPIDTLPQRMLSAAAAFINVRNSKLYISVNTRGLRCQLRLFSGNRLLSRPWHDLWHPLHRSLLRFITARRHCKPLYMSRQFYPSVALSRVSKGLRVVALFSPSVLFFHARMPQRRGGCLNLGYWIQVGYENHH